MTENKIAHRVKVVGVQLRSSLSWGLWRANRGPGTRDTRSRFTSFTQQGPDLMDTNGPPMRPYSLMPSRTSEVRRGCAPGVVASVKWEGCCVNDLENRPRQSCPLREAGKKSIDSERAKRSRKKSKRMKMIPQFPRRHGRTRLNCSSSPNQLSTD